MDSPVADDADAAREYLEHLVLSAISGRRGRSGDVAGRVVAVLLEALTAAGGSDRAARYLAPAPGGACHFEMLGAHGAPSAITRAGGGVSPGGGDRSGVAQDDPPGGVASYPAGGVTTYPQVGVDDSGVGEGGLDEGGLDEGGEGSRPDLAEVFDALAVAASEGNTGLFVEAVAVDGTRRRALEQTQDGVAAYVFPAAAQLRGAPDAVAEAAEQWAWTLSTWAHSSLEATTTSYPEIVATSSNRSVAGGTMTADTLVDAVRDALADIAVEVDLQAVEAAVATALAPAIDDAMRRQEATTEELRAAVREELLAASPALRPPPVPPVDVDQMAGVVVAALGSVIDTAVATSDVERDVVVRTLGTVSDELHLLLEGFADRVRSATRALESLADSIATEARATDSYMDRVTTSMDRLGQRLEHRLELLEAAQGGSRISRDGGQPGIPPLDGTQPAPPAPDVPQPSDVPKAPGGRP